MKTAGKGAPTHQGMGRQRVQGVRLGQMGTQVIEQLVHPDIAGGGGHRLLDKLGLTPFPVGRDHQPPRHLVGDGRAVVLAHQIEAAIQPGGSACRGDQPLVIHIESIGIELHAGKAAAEILFVLPVGRRFATIEQPGVGEHIGAEAESDQPCASGSGDNQGIEQCCGWLCCRVVPEGDDDDLSLGQHLQPMRSLNGEALRRV